ncbi:MAG TPA: NAD(P)H-hydrate dehydratase, partial [Micromonosporaceae bacterium]
MSEVATVDGTRLRHDWPLPDPSDADSKHDRGSITVIGGSASTPGAVLLAGLAALRAGAGRLTIATAASTSSALAVAVPEAAVVGLLESTAGALDESAVADAASASEDAQAVLIGPGLQEPDGARDFVDALLAKLPGGATLVVDALAITCGSDDAIRSWGSRGQVIVTPNDTEAQRLLGDSAANRSDADIAAMVAAHLGAVTVLGS